MHVDCEILANGDLRVTVNDGSREELKEALADECAYYWGIFATFSSPIPAMADLPLLARATRIRQSV